MGSSVDHSLTLFNHDLVNFVRQSMLYAGTGGDAADPDGAKVPREDGRNPGWKGRTAFYRSVDLEMRSAPCSPKGQSCRKKCTAFGTKSAEELPNGARSEWLRLGKAAEIFGRAWDVRLSA
eukprot:359008-Chlamydomonas_euryale.AAC.1